MATASKLYLIEPDIQALVDMNLPLLLKKLQLQQSKYNRDHTGDRCLKLNSKLAYKKHIRGLKYFCSLIGDYESLLPLMDKPPEPFCPSMSAKTIANFIVFKRSQSGTPFIPLGQDEKSCDVLGRPIYCQGGWVDPHNVGQMLSAITVLHAARGQRGNFVEKCVDCSALLKKMKSHEYFVDHLCGCHGQTNVLRVVQSVMNFNKPTTTYDSIREFCSSNLSADNSRQLIQLIDTFAMELRCKFAQNDSDVGVLNTTPNDEKMDGYIDTKQTPGSSKRKRGGTFDFEGRHSLRKVPDPIAKLKQIINYHEQIPQDYSQMTEPAGMFALTTLIPVVLCLKHHCQGDEATFLTRWAPFNHSNFIKKCCNGKGEACSNII